MENEKNTERVITLLSKKTIEELQIDAKEKGLTVSGLIRMLILEYLKDKKKNG